MWLSFNKKTVPDFNVPQSVLLVDRIFTPLRSISRKRALKLDYLKKGYFLLPEVIQLYNYQHTNRRHNLKYTKRAIYLRDRYTCQYCGKELAQSSVTIDHVMPLSRGGTNHFKNCVAACVKCNTKKSNKLPSEAGMKLLQEPWEPTSMDLLREHIRPLLNKFQEYLKNSLYT